MRNVSPKLRGYLDEFNAKIPLLIEAGFKANATNAREWLASVTKDMVTDVPEIPGVWDDIVPGAEYDVPVRIYHPAPSEKRPVLIHFHGGGHTAGSVSAYDPICRKFANATGHVLVTAEYRRAPECPYPAGLRDAMTVVKGIWPILDARNLNYIKEMSLIGDSAGGALAASVAGLAQFDPGIAIKRSVLIYPGLDYTLSCPSFIENAEGYLLQTAKVIWYYDLYFQHCENRKAASPLFGEFTTGLPETFVISAEFCPLRDENIAYVKKLDEAGVKTRHLHFPDMTHTFMNLENLVKEECDQLYREVADFLNQE
jgi:acetyl esterase/lipase